MKPLTRIVSTGALLCAASFPLASHGECKRAVLDLPVTITGTRPVISAKINHQDVRLLVDSGAFFSIMSSAAAHELQLKIGMAPFGLTLSGVGGSVAPGLAVAKTFTLANIDIPNVQFLVGGTEGGSGTIGVLGQNFLEKWNVEYDLSKGMIRLFKDTGCSGKFLAYWAQQTQAPYTLTQIDKITPQAPHTIARAYVNGEKIRVMFDTGAFVSILSLRAAERAGVKLDAPGVQDGGVIIGIGGRLVPSYIVPFASFKFADGEEIKNARLRVADIGMSSADMAVGGDFFLSHRILVANSQDQMYFTYNGGPVFDLRKKDAKTAVAEARTVAADAPGAAASAPALADNPPAASAADGKTAEPAQPAAPEDAAALARRATGSAGRHDYDSAVADLSRAIELDPNNPEYFYERGRVFWSKKEQPKALADFDRTIELKPDHVPALIDRAELRLNAKNVPEARADLEAIDKIAAKQADVRYELAFAYERADSLELAIAQYELWLVSHRDDARRLYAYTGICRDRGILGMDTDAALKACNEAVSLSDKKKNANLLDDRALVYLRLGNYDKAIKDFDASLKIEPERAWTYYGRGLAKLKKNQRGEGDKDIADAVRIAPNVGDAYTRMGLSP